MIEFIRNVSVVEGVEPEPEVLWMKVAGIFLFVFLLPTSIFGQSLSLDQFPPGLNWKEIRTDEIHLIFPADLSEEALRVALLLEAIAPTLGETLDTDFPRYPVILSNQSAFANGYLTFMPKRSYWNYLPMQAGVIGMGDWYNLLGVHEGRHMVQFDKLNSSTLRVAGLLWGEAAVSSLIALSIPNWWFEGDAVSIETALLNTGRGWNPDFLSSLKAQLLEGEVPPYLKQYFGSYKDPTIGYYELGYVLVSYVRLHYGAECWSRILDRVSDFPFIPLRFYWAVKKETGKSFLDIYDDALNELKDFWEQNYPAITMSSPKNITPDTGKEFWNYYSPKALADGSIVAIKRGADQLSSLVRISSEGEERIFPLYPQESLISAAGEVVVWAEVVPDPRWGERQWSDIFVCDLSSGDKRRVTRGEKYFAPAISPDLASIVAVEFSPERRSSIVILDVMNGDLLRRIESGDRGTFRTPAWSPDGKRIVCTLERPEGKSLVLLDPKSGEFREVLSPSVGGPVHPVFWNQYLLYGSQETGKSAIHALDLETGEKYLVQGGLYGLQQPEVSNGTLVFREYTSSGYRIRETELRPGEWQPIEEVPVTGIPFPGDLAEQETPLKLPGISSGPAPGIQDLQKLYNLHDYRPFPVNVHSWGIIPNSLELSGLTEPVMSLDAYLLSRDLLNTLDLQIYGRYIFEENTFGGGFEGTYAGWWPYLTFGGEINQRAPGLFDLSGEPWLEMTFNGGIQIPLNFSRGIWSRYLNPGVLATLRSEYHTDSNYELLGVPLTWFLNAGNLSASSKRDLYPPRGQELHLRFTHVPIPEGDTSWLFTALGNIYFPGFLLHHSLNGEGGVEKGSIDGWTFGSQMVDPRGYVRSIHDWYYGFSLNYSFPIFYPDLAFGTWFYWTRLSGNLFYDHGLGNSSGVETLYQSVGTEIFWEFYLFSWPIEWEVGVRFGYRIPEGDFFIQDTVFGFGYSF